MAKPGKGGGNFGHLDVIGGVQGGKGRDRCL